MSVTLTVHYSDYIRLNEVPKIIGNAEPKLYLDRSSCKLPISLVDVDVTSARSLTSHLQATYNLCNCNHVHSPRLFPSSGCFGVSCVVTLSLSTVVKSDSVACNVKGGEEMRARCLPKEKNPF